MAGIWRGTLGAAPLLSMLSLRRRAALGGRGCVRRPVWAETRRGMSFSPIFFACLAVSALASAAYGFYFLRRPPTLPRAAVKTLSILALAAAAYTTNLHPVLIAALVFSAIGDFLLALDKPATLILGILAFLLAQLTYAAIFFALWLLGQPLEPLWARYALLALFGASVLVFLLWLWREEKTPAGKPHAYVAMLGGLGLGFLPLALIPVILAISFGTVGNMPPLVWLVAAALVLVFGALVWLRRDIGPMKFGVMPYVVAITTMGSLTLFGSWAAWPAIAGAALFMISDGVIAAELFKLTPESPARRITAPVIWWAYYAAQILLGLGIILGWRTMA